MVGDPDLDELWAKFRNFFNDVDEDTKEKLPLADPEKAARIRFTKNCERYGIMSSSKDQLGYTDMRRALIGCSYKNEIPHEMMLVKLARALEAYNEETEKFYWRRFLEAPYTHENVSLNGKFPRAVRSPFHHFNRNKKERPGKNRRKNRKRKRKPTKKIFKRKLKRRKGKRRSKISWST